MASGTRLINACFVSLKVCFLSIVIFVLTACKSDEERYKRLNQDLLIAQLQLSNLERAEVAHQPLCPDLADMETNAYMKACYERVEEQRTKVALLQREMNKFMHR